MCDVAVEDLYKVASGLRPAHRVTVWDTDQGPDLMDQSEPLPFVPGHALICVLQRHKIALEIELLGHLRLFAEHGCLVLVVSSAGPVSLPPSYEQPHPSLPCPASAQVCEPYNESADNAIHGIMSMIQVITLPLSPLFSPSPPPLSLCLPLPPPPSPPPSFRLLTCS